MAIRYETVNGRPRYENDTSTHAYEVSRSMNCRFTRETNCNNAMRAMVSLAWSVTLSQQSFQKEASAPKVFVFSDSQLFGRNQVTQR